jgi:hypothetical protein
VVWFRIDDGWHSHPKVIDVSLAARGLWATAGSWCGQHLTDGAVPTKMLKAWGGTPKLVDELVRAGLWKVSEAGYQFHDWSALNPLRADVLKSRAADVQRKKESRGSPPGRPPGQKSDSTPTPPVTPNGHPAGSVTDSSRALPRSRPDPTDPDPTESAARSCDAAAVAAFFAPGAESKPQTGLSPETCVQECWDAVFHSGKWSGHIPRADIGDVLRILADRGLGTDVLPALMTRWSSARKSTAAPRLEYFRNDLAGLLDAKPAAAASVPKSHRLLT